MKASNREKLLISMHKLVQNFLVLQRIVAVADQRVEMFKAMGFKLFYEKYIFINFSFFFFPLENLNLFYVRLRKNCHEKRNNRDSRE